MPQYQIATVRAKSTAKTRIRIDLISVYTKDGLEDLSLLTSNAGVTGEAHIGDFHKAVSDTIRMSCAIEMRTCDLGGTDLNRGYFHPPAISAARHGNCILVFVERLPAASILHH
jgi:hypothetical protein